MKRLAVVTLLFGSLVTSAAEEAQFDPEAKPANLAADFLRMSRPSALSGTKLVAIANFRVEFVVETRGEATPSKSGTWVTSSSVIKLVGVNDKVRVAIADTLYDKFVEGLGSAGVTVVPYETLRKVTQYRELGTALKTTQKPVQTRTGTSMFVGPHGMPVYFTNDDKHVTASAALSGFGKQPHSNEPLIAEALDAVLLRVTLAVYLVEKRIGPTWAPALPAETKVVLAFVPPLTQVLCVNADGAAARITLADAILMPEDTLAVRDQTSTGESVADAIGTATGGVFAGSIGKGRRYDAIVAEEDYSGTIIRYGTALEAAMVSLLRTAVRPAVDE